MQFTKVLGNTRNPGDFGHATIANGTITVRIKAVNKSIAVMGIVDGGIGVELSDSDKKLKMPYIQTARVFDKEDIPVNLQATGYKFKIPAEKVSENEYVFLFKNAKMA